MLRNMQRSVNKRKRSYQICNRKKIRNLCKGQVMGEKQVIREMKTEDWNSVERIYTQSLKKGNATFVSECPTYEMWDAGRLKECRFVYESEGDVVGYVTISPTSGKPHFKGVVEVSIYVDEQHLHKGIGTALLKHLCEESEKLGYWTIYSSIFPENIASIELHKKCGFRVIGYREKIAKDIFGNWRTTTIMERRNGIV